MMKRHNQIGTVTEIDPRAVHQIMAMIEDMRRVVRLLEEDIAVAEVRARVDDTADVAYPLDARAMGERRDNLAKTMASLAERLPESRKAA
jgi:hypothetical protein